MVIFGNMSISSNEIFENKCWALQFIRQATLKAKFTVFVLDGEGSRILVSVRNVELFACFCDQASDWLVSGY